MYAAAKGRTEACLTLLQNGADVNQQNKEGNSALMRACSSDLFETA